MLPARTTADLVLRGGRVFRGKGLEEAEAIAVSGGTVLASGSSREISSLEEARTRVVELGGRLVVPGFNDSHVHLIDGGASLLAPHLRDARDEGEWAGRVTAHARGLPGGAWILNGQWDHEAWPSRRLPTRASIDPGTASHPVFLLRLDGHMALANSLALRLAGIGRGTPDPPGGEIGRDPSGEPTGILKDTAMDLVLRVAPPPTQETYLQATRAALKEAARVGVTTIQDNSLAAALPAYLELREKGELTARLSVWRYGHTLDSLLAGGVRSGLGDDWIRLGPLKILSDGSMGAGTAALFEPYSDEPGKRGLLLYSEEDLLRLMAKADQAGFQLAVHAIGDRAVHLVLDAFEAISRAHPRQGRRFRMEHAQIVAEEDLGRFSALRVIASVQPCHLVDDMRFAERRIGKDRCRGLYRIASLLRTGVDVAFGTDWPVEPLDPRVGLYAAITREFSEGGPPGGFSPEEKITLVEALDLYTRGSAYAEFAEDRKGTLETGFLADLVVFHEDLFSVPPRRILEVPVDMTVVGGEVVYERRMSP